MKIEDIMVKDIKSVRQDDIIKDVVILICTNQISGIPVLDDEGRIEGIISEKDILKAMYPSYIEFYNDPARARDFEETEERYKELLAHQVKDVMTREVWTITPDMPILKAASLMIIKKVRRLPVVDQGKIVGIVSQGDIHQAIFRNKLIH